MDLNKATFSICKALNHLNSCIFYLEATIIEAKATHGAKHFLQQQANKCKSVIQDVRLRVRPESREHLNTEMSDPLYIDSMVDGLLCLNPDNRLIVENLMSSLIDEQIKSKK